MCPRLTSVLACALVLSTSVTAAPVGDRPSAETISASRPSSAGRVTRRFTFEERGFNPTDFPINWIRAQHDPPSRVRPGFPIWNQAGLDYTVRRSGEGSVRLPTRGGSTSLLLDPGVIPVFPEADYTIVAGVRTHGVDHARARLVARLLDAAGVPIPGSEVGSPPVQTRGAWAPIAVRVLGDAPAAASLQIELLLEQPGPAGEIPFEELEVVPSDYEGAAWFDDISIIQVPRVELWADPPGNMFESDEQPAVKLLLRDMVGQPLDVRLEAIDAEGDVVASEQVAFEGGRLEREWTPQLREFGWYRVRITAAQGGALVGAAATDLVWRGTGAPGEGAGSDGAATMSVLIDGVPTEGLRELADLVLDAGIPRVLTDLWFEGQDIDAPRRDALALVANRLFPRRRELGLAVRGLPPGVEGLGGIVGLLDAMTDPASPGAEWLDPLLVDLGHRVRRWSFGEADSIDTADISELGDAIDRLRDLVPGAELGLPVSPYQILTPGHVGPSRSIVQRLDPGVPIDEIASVLGGFARASEGQRLSGWDAPSHIAAFTANDDEPIGRRGSIERLVLAALHARAAFDSDDRDAAPPKELRLEGAWRWQAGRRAELMPDPEAAAWLTLAGALAGRRAEPLGSLAPGVEAMLLVPRDAHGSRTAAVVLWPGVGPDAPAQAGVRLSEGDVHAVDLDGNTVRVPAERVGETELRAHRVDLTGGPVYVEGVDPALLRFIAAARTAEDMIATTVEGGLLHFSFTNPWPGPIRGDYFLVEPGGLSEGDRAARDRSWDIRPRHGTISADAGETVTVELRVDTSPGVLSGMHDLVLDLDVVSPTITGSFRVVREIEAGLRHLKLDLVTRYGPGPNGPDAVIYAIVTNTGLTTETVDLYALAPGYARERSAATPVTPGTPAVKVFSFDGGRDALAGKEINVGLFIREAGARLRQRVTLDDGG